MNERDIMSVNQKDEIILDAVSMVIKLVAFYDHPTGERYQKMIAAIRMILISCVNFKGLGIEPSSEFLDSTFGVLKIQVMQFIADNEAQEPTKQ